jgi:lysyl-tRNA synthetase class 2
MARVREFFAARGLLEVDTPLLVNAPVSDVHLHSATVHLAPDAPSFFLHTSPEYAMKRLLAAGCGDIFQVCHVVRGFESGRLHNPEFTLVEWYRVGFSLEQLMGEVEELVRALLGSAATRRLTEHLSYREAFVRELSLDPLTASAVQLAQAAAPLGLSAAPEPAAPATDAGAAAARDELLELLMGARVGPRLGQGALTFVHGYPASQAALARLDPADPRTARRFELYCDGIELANGFHELASAPEQRARFAADNAERARRGLPVHAPDERLLAALAAGLPDCAGVALGFDRTLMLATAAARLDEVLPFPTDRA